MQSTLQTTEKGGRAPATTEPALLCEFCDWRDTAPRIDRPQGVLRGVKILGMRSQNGRIYLPEALTAAAGFYEGAKVNVNHPKGHPRAPRDYQERIGTLRNVSVRAGDGLYGDFHFNPCHLLAEQLLWDAAHAPQNVGFSHNVEARTARRDQQTVVEAITRVVSVDLVADPATTAGLFEAAAADALLLSAAPPQLTGATPRTPQAPTAEESLTALTSEQLRVMRPDLVEALLLETRATWQQLNHENQALRQQLEAARRQADETAQTVARAQRQSQIATLLAEHGLPPAGSDDPAARAMTSDAFVAALLEAADEQGLRRLIAERAQLIEAARRGHVPAAGAARPISHAPHAPQLPVLDTLAFVRAVRG